eukprot:TRINITY_DN42495_c0_g1_i1.p1 TRINITY_DN42495_c0_g1~~TRINITY_DN42495_c0_g1_i1.p1  ORF type:complete len:883 (+),score=344.62 TRINITY_DN42495_c0_g1_i1:41-2650(+)
MGQVCCGGKTKHAGAATEDARPDRTLEALMSQEKAMVGRVKKHLRNVVPGLLVYVLNEKVVDISESATPEEVEVRTSELLQTCINTLRHALISYSKAYRGDSNWFKIGLTSKEAMMLLNAFITDRHNNLSSSKVFPTKTQQEFAKKFVAHFKIVWEKTQEGGDIKQTLSGVYWKETASLCDFFMQADTDAGGDLDVDEIEKIMHKQNIGLEGARLRRLIMKEDQSADGKLDFREYISFFLKITEKRYIQQVLFREYVKTEPSQIMKPNEFHEFLTKSQGESGDQQETNKLLTKLKELGMAVKFKAADGSEQLGLSSRHFAQFLTSFPTNYEEEKSWAAKDIPHNSCYDSRYTTKIYQDMKRPLTDYFVNSSHNTYLDNGQLTGQSSAVAYQNALMLGCRCLEIDCWDGDDGEPIVYHGHTLTTKVKFEEVIKAIDKYAFKKSQYPVILSLEVHTSPDQQTKMGQIMKQVFRRKGPDGTLHSILQPPIAYTDHKRTAVDFTPEGLKGKILVKGKILCQEDGMDLFNEHLRLVKEMTLMQPENKLCMDETRGADDEDDAPAEVAAEIQKASKVKLSPELSSCVWMKSVHYRGYEGTKAKGNHWDVSSFTESAVEKFYATEKSREEYAASNKLVFSRIYPSGTRVNSDNYHPQISWNMGCQIVALNFQIEHNKSAELRYNLGKFVDNGKCGYLLKPPPLIDPDRKHNDFKDNAVVTVEVLQGFRLPKPMSESEGEKIDPYAIVNMNGVDSDVKKGHCTKIIDDNGWNPEFFTIADSKKKDELLQFKHIKKMTPNQGGSNIYKFNVQSIDMAMLTIQVWDKDVADDDFIGEAVIPVKCLRKGYRAVPLKSEVFVQLDALVFCRFDIEIPEKSA